MIGAIAMLVVNLGIGRLADDARLARLMAAATPEATVVPDSAASGAGISVGISAEAGPASPAPAGPGKATAPVAPLTPNKSAAAPARSAPPPTTASPIPAPPLALPPPATTAEAEPPIEKAAPEAANPPPSTEPRSPAAAPAQRRLPLAQTDPNVACAPRTNFALFQCVKSQCQETSFYAHPTCVVLRRTDELPAAAPGATVTDPIQAESAASAP